TSSRRWCSAPTARARSPCSAIARPDRSIPTHQRVVALEVARGWTRRTRLKRGRRASEGRDGKESVMFRPLRSGALGALLALALGAPALALPPGVHCGDDYWFQVEPPDGWREDWRAHGEQLGVVFEPPTGSPEAAETRIALTLFPAQGDDPQQTLDRALWLVLFTASPTAIEDEPLRHAHLRSRAVRVTAEQGSLLLVAVAPAGRHHYVLSVARAGSREPADLALARRILRSLRVDPERACLPGPDGAPVEVMRADAGRVPPAAL